MTRTAKDWETVVSRFMNKVEYDPNGGCWLWSAASGYGYGRVCIDKKFHAAHRFSYAAFVGPIPDGAHVMHKCDVTACVNPAHLRCGTRADNMNDMVQKGRNRNGEAYRRMSADEVQAILSSTAPTKLLAREIGRSSASVRRIRKLALSRAQPNTREGG